MESDYKVPDHVDLVMFLGRNIIGILTDYIRISKANVMSLTVVARDGDPLLNNGDVDLMLKNIVEDTKIKTIDQFLGGVISNPSTNQPIYTLICNGGTTSQQVPVVKWMSRRLPDTIFLEVSRDNIDVL